MLSFSYFPLPLLVQRIKWRMSDFRRSFRFLQRLENQAGSSAGQRPFFFRGDTKVKRIRTYVYSTLHIPSRSNSHEGLLQCGEASFRAYLFAPQQARPRKAKRAISAISGSVV